MLKKEKILAKEKIRQEKMSWRRRDFLKIDLVASLSPLIGSEEGDKKFYISEIKAIASSKPPESTSASPNFPPVSANAPLMEFRGPPIEPARIGMVGVGDMGSAHVRNFLKIEGPIIIAVGDIVEEKVARIQKWVEEAGFPRPKGYSKGPLISCVSATNPISILSSPQLPVNGMSQFVWQP